MQEQKKYMQRCLELAARGLGRVSPNPMVGCVIVSNDRIIGEGYHQCYGQAHAEVNALQSVKTPLPADAVMYVSLEPCNHYGKTPPCTEAILSSGIRQVVIACRDARQSFRGNGVGYLRKHGVQVTTGLMNDEARYLNRRFFTYHEQKRPYVILKWAQTADGFIGYGGGTSSRLVVSNQAAHQLVHRWRSEEDAILAGANTLLADNPQLTTRLWKGKSPVRVIIDRNLSLPSHLRVFNSDIRVIILNEKKSGEQGHLNYIQVSCRQPAALLSALHQQQIQSLLVEGGTKTLQMFLREGLYDEMRVIVSPHRVHQGIRAPQIDLMTGSMQRLGDNRLFILHKTS
jgi:diaminohydroxyphosphoribosylaminopyrimidine deaminase/5-amino-6-(5-phosphoribosylamino)uracil reductase